MSPTPSCHSAVPFVAFLKLLAPDPAHGLPAVHCWCAEQAVVGNFQFPYCDSKLPPPYHVSLAWGRGRGRSLLSGTVFSFLPPTCSLPSGPPSAPSARATLQLTLLLACRGPLPGPRRLPLGPLHRGVLPKLSCASRKLHPLTTLGTGPSPAEPRVPLFMRGRLEQAPRAGNRREGLGKCAEGWSTDVAAQIRPCQQKTG